MSELKRCPFCGGEVVMFTEQLDATRDCYNFHCDNCDMSIYYDYSDRNMAIKTWNNRKPLERVIERLEERKAQLEKSYKSGYGTSLELAQCNGAIVATENDIRIIKEEVG